MALRTLLAFLLCGWLSLSAQQDAPLGESLRVQVSGPVGLQAALAQHGVIGDHVQVHQQGAWQTATVIVGKQELRELRVKTVRPDDVTVEQTGAFQVSNATPGRD